MKKPSARSAAIAGAWLTAGALGATVLTGFAFAANNPSAPAPAGIAATAAPTPVAPGDGQGAGMQGEMGRHGGPGRGMPGMGGPNGPVLHGDIVVKDKDGVVKTIRVQNGKVTAVASGSITVASSDGFTSTWALNAGTKIRRDMADATADKVVVGDTVLVRGELGPGSPTAKVVRAFSPDGLAKAEQKRTERQQNRQDRKGQQAPGTTGGAVTPPAAADGAGFDVLGI